MATQKRIPGTFGPFTFAHPHLTSPDSEGKFADDKYKVDGVGDPGGPAIKAVKAALQAAAKELGVKIVKGETNLPLVAEKAKDDSGKKVPTGQQLLRGKSKFAPAIVDASGKPIPDKKLAKLKIGAGSTGLIQGYFGSYSMTVKERVDGEMTTTEVEGISFTLTGIQLLSVSAGNSGASFGAYEGGGYSADDDGDDGDDMDEAPETAADDDGDDGELDI
jgi:hypothetical protein